MAATATASSSGPRYAPEDPTLPKPWRGLVDGKTGYLYFWNPETNVTQYERPVVSSGSAPPHKSSAVSISSSVQVQQSSQGLRRDNSSIDDDDRYSRGNNGGPKLASGARSYQSARGGSDHSHTVANGTFVAGQGGSSGRGHGSTGGGGGLSAESYRRRHEITVTGDNVAQPFMSFESTALPSEILREVHNAGFSSPTPIQAQSWPIALQGRDIVAIAKTGSGKTLGYLIPGFMHIKRCRNNSQLGPTVLVLSPTRELATQIQEEAVKFGKSSKISCTCLYGGAPKGPQLRDLDRGADIVVATPGRLNDILEMRRVSLSQVSYLVLDEADRMLDMGFEPQIRKIVKEVPTRRQTLMYTATWPKEVRKIAADLLVKPVQVNIGNVDELVANKSITQYVEVLSSMEKHRRLEQILRSQEPGSKIIIFCSTKKMCDQLARNLSRQFGAVAIHGDKSQGERDHVLGQFRTGRSPVLVATDVAARGLDIKDIRVVVNYDFPTGVEDYVHRIGRTGRAGATGVSYTFFCDQDAKHASDLVKVLEGANQRVPVEIRDMASRGGGMCRSRPRWGSGSGGRDGGRGGHYDSGYSGRDGGRDGGRGSWGIPPSSERGGGRGSERESRDSDRYGRSVDAPGSYPNRSFHESMVRAGEKRSRSRSRSPNRGSGRADLRSRGRSRSRSVDRAQPVRERERSPVNSFHKVIMERARSPPTRNHRLSPYNGNNSREAMGFVNPLGRSRQRSQSPPDDDQRVKFGGSHDNGRQEWGKSPRGRRDDVVTAGTRPFFVEEEEEEGMIPADEEGMIPQDEDGLFQAADENPPPSSP